MSLVATKRRTGSYFLDYILRRIERNQNALLAITGATGSGKTYAALYFAKLLDPDFTIDHLCFTPTEFMKLVNAPEMKSGSVIIWDEVGVGLNNREWQSKGNKLLNFVMQTFRHKNYIVLFTSPHANFVDKGTRTLLHGRLETTGIDRRKKRCMIKPLLFQINQKDGRVFEKYLRVITPDTGLMQIKKLRAYLPDKELVKEYEKKKTEFTANMNRSIFAELEEVDSKGKKLTARQQEIYDLLLKHNRAGAAEILGVTDRTITDSVNGMRRKGFLLEPIKESGSNRVLYYKPADLNAME